MSADVAQPERSSRGSAWALGGLLALVLGCCVAGGLVAVLREGGKSGEVAAAGSAADGAREEPASVDGPFHYAAVRRTREAAPAVSDVVLRVTPTERAPDPAAQPPPSDDSSGALASLPPTAPPAPEPVEPVPPAIESRLRALGLLGTPKPNGPVAQTALDLLEQSGRALRFARVGVPYAQTAAALAALATPVLDDVLFRADTAGKDATGQGGEPDRLIAWSRGERFAVTTDPSLDWETLEGLVGLLNVLARSRQSSVRFVLNDPDGTAEVVVGLERSLRAAVAEGLIELRFDPVAPREAPAEQLLRALRGEAGE